MKKTKETALIVNEIAAVRPKEGEQPYILGCHAIDLETGEQVNASIGFDFSELLFVIATGRTLKETLNSGKESN